MMDGRLRRINAARLRLIGELESNRRTLEAARAEQGAGAGAGAVPPRSTGDLRRALERHAEILRQVRARRLEAAEILGMGADA